MAKEASAWMPLYVGDYLGDTQRLTTEQHGAYLLLILDYWRNGPAPDDDAVLQQITKLDAKAWKRHRPALERLFQITDGEWHHKRIDKELASAAANSDRRSSKAKAAAEARWGKSQAPKNECLDDAASNAPSMLQALLVECPPQSPCSVPNGTGETPSELPLEDGPEIDPVKAIFDLGVALLTNEGASPSAARSLIGKWRRDHTDGDVMGAIKAARELAIVEPKAWITKRLANGRGKSMSFEEESRRALYKIAQSYRRTA